jgi:hypothetical protein
MAGTRRKVRIYTTHTPPLSGVIGVAAVRHRSNAVGRFFDPGRRHILKNALLAAAWARSPREPCRLGAIENRTLHLRNL